MLLRLIFLLLTPLFLFGQIKAVVFSLNGFVSPTDPKRVCQWLMNSFDITEEEAQEALHYQWVFIDQGFGDDRAYWMQYFSCRGAALTPRWFRTWHFVVNNYMINDPEVQSIACKLKAQGYVTPLFANMNCYQDYTSAMPEDVDVFHPVATVADFCSDEEYHHSYNNFLNEMKLDPSEVLFITASYRYAKLCQAKGEDVIWYEGPERLIQSLADRGIVVSVF